MSTRDARLDRMPVVILAGGGMGTPLREETERLPKPLQKIGERPIFWHMKLYGHHGIGRVDVTAMLDFHRSHERIGPATGLHPTSRYGEMRVADGVVLEFDEKPPTREGFVSGGFFVFQRKVFDYLTPEPELPFERAPLAHLARDGQLADYPREGLWMGMDTYPERSELNRPWA